MAGPWCAGTRVPLMPQSAPAVRLPRWFAVLGPPRQAPCGPCLPLHSQVVLSVRQCSQCSKVTVRFTSALPGPSTVAVTGAKSAFTGHRSDSES